MKAKKSESKTSADCHVTIGVTNGTTSIPANGKAFPEPHVLNLCYGSLTLHWPLNVLLSKLESNTEIPLDEIWFVKDGGVVAKLVGIGPLEKPVSALLDKIVGD